MNEKENKWDKTWAKLYKIKHDPEVLQSERRAGGRKHCWEAPNTLHSWKDILREGCGPYTLGEISGKTTGPEGIFPFTPMKGHFSVSDPLPQHPFSWRVLGTPRRSAGGSESPPQGFCTLWPHFVAVWPWASLSATVDTAFLSTDKLPYNPVICSELWNLVTPGGWGLPLKKA